MFNVRMTGSQTMHADESSPEGSPERDTMRLAPQTDHLRAYSTSKKQLTEGT